jgi:hypothetical protein
MVIVRISAPAAAADRAAATAAGSAWVADRRWRHRPPFAREHIQVAGIVAIGCNKRVKSIAPVVMDALQAVSVRIPKTAVVDLLEIDYASRIITVVLVRRERRTGS